MPSRLALLGRREGPWIDISRVVSPMLHIVGLPDGSKVRVEIEHCDSAEFSSNGHHAFSPGTWARVCCDAPVGHKTICIILSKAA